MIDNEQTYYRRKITALADLLGLVCLFPNVVQSRRELAKRMKYQESRRCLWW